MMTQEDKIKAANDIFASAVALASARAKALFPQIDGAKNLTAKMYMCCLLTTFFTRFFYMEGKKKPDIVFFLQTLDKYMKEKMGDLYFELMFFLPNTSRFASEVMKNLPYNVENIRYSQADQDTCNRLCSFDCEQAAFNIVQNVKRALGLDLSEAALCKDAVSFCATAYPFLLKTINMYFSTT